MPNAAAHPCAAAGCAALTRTRWCELHGDERRAAGGRGTARERGYGAAWDRLSRRWRAAHPLCCTCAERGVTTAAELVDHIVPTDVDSTRIMDETNLQSLCRSCHAAKTAEDERRFGARAARTHARGRGG